MYFIAALLIFISLANSGAPALASWLAGIALIGFKLGCRSYEKEIDKRIGGER